MDKSRPDRANPEDPHLPATVPWNPGELARNEEVIDADFTEATPAQTLAAKLLEASGSIEVLLNLLETVTDVELLVEARAICKADGMSTPNLEVIADRIRVLRRASLGVTRVIDTYRDQLEVELTTEEIQDAAGQVVELTSQIATVDSERKAIAASHREQLKDLDSARSRQIIRYKTGRERRGVEVEDHLDLDTHKVRTIRTDTGEVIEERPATDKELQLDIDFSRKGEE